MKKISVWTAFLIAVLLCLATFMTTYTLVRRSTVPNTGLTDGIGISQNTSKEYSEFVTKLADKISEVDEIYRQQYIGELDDELLLDYAVMGYMTGTGDYFGNYFTADGFKEFVSETEGKVAGIGVQVIYNTEYGLIEVLSTIKDSPADHAGVLPGDLIATVGEERELVSELGYYGSIDKIRGDAGTSVTFSVLRGEDYSEELTFTVERAIVTSESVMFHVYDLDPSIGVIKITGFEVPTPDQFINAVESLQSAGCDKFVIDLRNNPGGELNSVINTLDYILPEGPVLRVKDADGNYVETYTSDKKELDVPMVVLTNERSASAAEIFAAAVRDYDKAKLVGTTTYGKGCMQSLFRLSDGSAVSVTFRLFEPPFSDSFHGIGIVPDVEVELDEALKEKNVFKITDEEDNQLAAAVALLAD